MAAALRHSRSQAEKTYDRRTAAHKADQAVTLAREYAEKNYFDAPTAGETVREPSKDIVKHNILPGQFVALVEEDSTWRSPKILVGQVHALLPNGKVSLLWYQSHKNLFHLKIDGKAWEEDVNCLLPVTLTPVRNKSGFYRLKDSLRQLHKAVHGRD